MNAYQESQTPGIEWPESRQALVYQPFRETPPWRKPRQRAAILEDYEQQMADFAAEHGTALDDLRKHYVFPADPSVMGFLTEHRILAQLLLEAAPKLEKYFGPTAVFNLRAPIDEAGSRMLYAVAIWPGPLQDVRNALERFDHEWWLARAGQAGGNLTFTYELV
jgi:hypothetical protein